MCPILEDKVRSDRSSFEFYRRLPWSPQNLFKFHHIRVLKYLIENPENKVTQKKKENLKQSDFINFEDMPSFSQLARLLSYPACVRRRRLFLKSCPMIEN